MVKCAVLYRSAGAVLVLIFPWGLDKLLMPLVTHDQRDARPTVTFPAVEHHYPLPYTELYWLDTGTKYLMSVGVYIPVCSRAYLKN